VGRLARPLVVRLAPRAAAPLTPLVLLLLLERLVRPTRQRGAHVTVAAMALDGVQPKAEIC
jgi:hypothetical protein